jgi:hypothetical protein
MLCWISILGGLLIMMGATRPLRGAVLLLPPLIPAHKKAHKTLDLG